jgi:hypothetical protein
LPPIAEGIDTSGEARAVLDAYIRGEIEARLRRGDFKHAWNRPLYAHPRIAIAVAF